MLNPIKFLVASTNHFAHPVSVDAPHDAVARLGARLGDELVVQPQDGTNRRWLFLVIETERGLGMRDANYSESELPL